jgi:hypothetical protein
MVVACATLVPTPGKWRTRGADDGGSPDLGWSEHVAKNWFISPARHPEHNPFTISGYVLTITAKRNPGISGVTNEWISGHLSTEPATSSFTYGYVEVRARMAVPGRGMFPAIWRVNNRIASDAEDPDKPPRGSVTSACPSAWTWRWTPSSRGPSRPRPPTRHPASS